MFSEEKFTFWCPLEKSEDIDPTTGELVMRLGGIASTSDEDSDGEFLDPKGFDIQPLIKSGMVNWHHQAKGQPATIIGEPSKAEIRPDGLYLETDLYPSSKIAQEVWELANTLEKDSKTRRLGYSIEGKVLKRKSEDKNNPGYKKIEKAIITGVAITHMPKNPKTFANIIKGEGCEDEEEDEIEKELNTENAKAVKKESVDNKLKITTFTKGELMNRIFAAIPGISIEKAKQLSIKIKEFVMDKTIEKGIVTDEDIEKAYEALGFCVAENIVKSKTEDEEEEEEEEDKKEDEEDEEEEDDDSKDVKKGGFSDNRLDTIEKAIATVHASTSKYIRALGVMVKDVTDKLDASAVREAELLDVIKAQDETISALNSSVEEFGGMSQGRKSLSSARAVERQFQKGSDANDFVEKHEALSGGISMSQQSTTVAEILDQATFSKGFDEEFSKACTNFEATKMLPAAIISRLKNEFNVNIVK